MTEDQDFPVAGSREEMLTLRARLGERIRGLRLERGLRLADVAALAGLSEPHLSRLERGQRWPSLQILLSLSNVYGVDASTLLWGPLAPAFVSSHEASATWEGPEVSGTGMMIGQTAQIPFDRESRLAMTDASGEGGTARATGSPEELLGMAFAGSFSLALARQLEAAGFEPRRVETKAEVELAASALGHAISDIRLRCEADADGVDEKTLQEIAGLTKRLCVVGRALMGVHVNVDASLLDPAGRKRPAAGGKRSS